jgi:hypothetical protein
MTYSPMASDRSSAVPGMRSARVTRHNSPEPPDFFRSHSETGRLELVTRDATPVPPPFFHGYSETGRLDGGFEGSTIAAEFRRDWKNIPGPHAWRTNRCRAVRRNLPAMILGDATHDCKSGRFSSLRRLANRVMLLPADRLSSRPPPRRQVRPRVQCQTSLDSI